MTGYRTPNPDTRQPISDSPEELNHRITLSCSDRSVAWGSPSKLPILQRSCTRRRGNVTGCVDRKATAIRSTKTGRRAAALNATSSLLTPTDGGRSVQIDRDRHPRSLNASLRLSCHIECGADSASILKRSSECSTMMESRMGLLRYAPRYASYRCSRAIASRRSADQTAACHGNMHWF